MHARCSMFLSLHGNIHDVSYGINMYFRLKAHELSLYIYIYIWRKRPWFQQELILFYKQLQAVFCPTMQLISIFAVIVPVFGHTMTSQYTSKQTRQIHLKNSSISQKYFRDFFILLFLGVNKSLRLYQMKLKFCQPTVCNKCRKIVYERYPRKHVNRCNRVLELEDCCEQTKAYGHCLFC